MSSSIITVGCCKTRASNCSLVRTRHLDSLVATTEAVLSVSFNILISPMTAGAEKLAV